MRAWMLAPVAALSAMLAARAVAQGPVITSFRGNGWLSWTHAVNTNALYRVEWSSRAGGPWHAFT
jgi:hypothetical protein